MLERLNRVASSRMRPDLESAIEYLPGLASLALWCGFADTDEPGVIAYTDGNTIYAGAGYEEFEQKERRFICLHEILHIALCHPQRFEELEKRDPANFNPKLLNIAADAVINASLENLTALETPKNAWTLSRLWDCLEKSEDAKNPQAAEANKNSYHYSFNLAAREQRKIANLKKEDFTRVSRWSCEELYYFLKSRCQAESGLYAIVIEFERRDALAGDLRVKQRESYETCETRTPNNNLTAEAQGDEEKRNWQQRLSLLRGSVPELLERLAKDLPRVETPWEQIFRSIVQTAFQEASEKNYSRPNRRWLALERDYRACAGVDLPFAPDTVKKRGTRLAVALDTSGSIDGELLGRFLAEIAAMCHFNQRNLVLIVGDAAVHLITEIDWIDVSDELSRIKYTGGGGTDFRPLIIAAKDFEPDALIYLTDLYGETGEEPDFPVIWATHGIAGDAPWGEQIKLK
ncbi:MAG TPA: VWA-like domain-containing protein [Pyrinomonadaceae bacterium]|nr:VWA-like domain-containing protein [Pyrinomonadaceae bacterium]